MNKLKTGLLLIILGNILYFAYNLFSPIVSSNFGDFSSGLLLGVSTSINLIGIIIIVIYISNNKNN